MPKDIVQIKGTMHGLIITMDGNQDYNLLKDNLREKIESSNGFFNGAKFTFRIDNNIIGDHHTNELRDFCLSKGLIYDSAIPFPIKQREKLGLQGIEAKESNKQKEPAAELAVQPPELQVAPPETKLAPLQAYSAEKADQVSSKGLTQSELDQETLLVNQNLRSGQKIIYPGHVVVMGDVNPGAYIIAGGNIIIMGTLRGTAHAGASGDMDSSIVAYKLKPSQIRIAQLIGRSPDNEASLLASSPEAAKVTEGQIVVEQINLPRTARKPAIAR